jgi:hypothetical protein
MANPLDELLPIRKILVDGSEVEFVRDIDFASSSFTLAIVDGVIVVTLPAAARFTATTAGFFGATPVTQRTRAGQLTDNITGSVSGTLAAVPDPTDSPATADALRDNLVATTIPKLRDAISSLARKVNTIEQALHDLGLTT